LRSGLVDGVIVLAYTRHGLAWHIVRGYTHPDGMVIAQPYRGLDCRRLAEPPSTLLPCIGGRAWLVRVSDIVLRLWPEDSYRLIAASTPLDEMLGEIGAYWRGLTGSRPIGCHGRRSDYDLLAVVDARRAFRVLQRMLEEGRIEQCKSDLREKREERVPGDASLHPEIVERSLTDSCYHGTPFTLRLLRRLSDSVCLGSETPLGKVSFTAEIRPDWESILVPARYRVKLDNGMSVVVETWRTRYQSLPSGLYRVAGTLYYSPEGYKVKVDWDGYIAVEELW